MLSLHDIFFLSGPFTSIILFLSPFLYAMVLFRFLSKGKHLFTIPIAILLFLILAAASLGYLVGMDELKQLLAVATPESRDYVKERGTQFALVPLAFGLLSTFPAVCLSLLSKKIFAKQTEPKSE